MKSAKEGIKFIFSHFAQDDVARFPRTVSTMVTFNGQRLVFDFQRIQDYFEASDYIDCRISGYPNYDWLAQHNKIPWGFIPKYWLLFIDQERGDIQKTLHNIKILFNGGSPTVLATGNGCHIYLPVLITNHDFFFNNDKNLIVEFLRYAAKRVTEGFSDKGNFPGLGNTMMRVPGSYNLKCILNGREPSEVRILQEWDGFRVSPSKDLLRDFQHTQTKKRIWEMQQQREANEKLKELQRLKVEGKLLPPGDPLTEFLIFESRGISDSRKNMLYYVISRHLIRHKLLDINTARAVCFQWLERCNRVRKLDDTSHYLKYHVNHCLKDAINRNRDAFSVEILKNWSIQAYNELITEYEEFKSKSQIETTTTTTSTTQ